MNTLKKLSILILILITSINLQARIQECFACHGRHGERNTMVPQSKPNTMTKNEIIIALNAYKAKTLDKYQKAKLIYRYKKNLSSKEIEKIANLWGK